MLNDASDHLAIHHPRKQLLRDRSLNILNRLCRYCPSCCCCCCCSCNLSLLLLCYWSWRQDVHTASLCGQDSRRIHTLPGQVDHARVDFVKVHHRSCSQDLELDRLGVDHVERGDQRLDTETRLSTGIHRNGRDLGLDLDGRVLTGKDVDRLIQLGILEDHVVVVLKVLLRVSVDFFF